MRLIVLFIVTCFLVVITVMMMQKPRKTQNIYTHTIDNYTSAQPQAQPNQVYRSFSGVPPYPIAGVDCTGTNCPVNCPNYVYGPGYAYDYGYPMGYGYGWGRSHGGGHGHGHGR
jgi:hypothetical protein